MTVQVFVSYSRKDIAIVRSVVAFLEQQFVVWWDDDIVGGTDFSKGIFAKIDKSQVALVFWSANAAISKWVGKESQAAVHSSICIPVRLDSTPLPLHLSHLDAVDLRSWDGRDDSRELRKLAQDISLHLAAATKPTGMDIATAQVPDNNTNDPIGSLGLFFLYFIIVGACWWNINWWSPLQEPWLLVGLIVINVPLLLHLASGRPSFAGVGESIVTGTSFFLILAICALIFSFVFPYGWDGTSVQRELAKRQVEALVARKERCTGVLIANFMKKKKPRNQIAGFSPNENSATNSPVEPRQLSIDEQLMMIGCVGKDDWQNFQDSSTVQSDIQNPPFLAEFPTENDWSQKAKDLLLAGQFDEARLLLIGWEARDAAARNVLAVLDALEIGHGADPISAFENFRIAAAKGNLIAKANLAICYIFGFGIPVDPIYGGQLLSKSIQDGLDPFKATWLLHKGLSLLQVDSFSEVIKSIRLEANKGSRIATAIEGILAAHWLAKEPCAPKCGDLARNIAKRLKNLGEPALAGLVEANISGKKGDEAAIREAARSYPETVLKTPMQRHLEEAAARLESERARISRTHVRVR